MPQDQADPNSELKREIIEGVRALLSTFSAHGVDLSGGSRLEASLQNLQTGPPASSTYLMIAFAAASISWAARETGRSEEEILDGLAIGFGVEPGTGRLGGPA